MTNITQQEIIDDAIKSNLWREPSDLERKDNKFADAIAQVRLDNINQFAQLIEARLAACSDDRQCEPATNEREAFEKIANKDAWVNKLGINFELDATGTYEYKYDKANLIYSIFLSGREYQASLAAPQQAIPAVDALREISNWLACWPISTSEDMAQSFEYMSKLAGDALSAAPSTTEATQTDAVKEAFEAAAKICDAQSKRHADRADQEDDESECSVLKSTAWQFSIAAHDIRALIPDTQGDKQ